MTRRKTFRFIEIGSTVPFVEVSPEQRETVRAEFCGAGDRLVGFFGFVFPHKCVEQLFEIADPQRDVLLLIGELDENDAYQRAIRAMTREPKWKGRAVVTGSVSAERAATLLAVCDAVVFPFREGTGTSNSSVRAAIGQGTFVIGTSAERRGYDEEQHVFYAAPGDVPAMRYALNRHAGERRPARAEEFDREWDAIAESHVRFYREMILR